MHLGPSRRHLVRGALLGAVFVNVARASARSVQLDISLNGWTALEPWTSALRRRVAAWWPIMTAALASPGFAPPDVVHIAIFNVTPEVVARLSGTPLYRRLGVHASGVAAVTRNTTIRLNGPLFLARIHDPAMFGIVAHELTHVIQSYPHGAATWLAEGVADYVRFYLLMPEDPGRRFDPQMTTYDSGYQSTAGLLDWVERARPGAVREINAAMRRGEDGPAVLARIAGAPPPALWRAYLASAPDAAR